MYVNLQYSVDDFLTITQSDIIYKIKDYIYVYLVSYVLEHVKDLTNSENDKILRLYQKPTGSFYLLNNEKTEDFLMKISMLLLNGLVNAKFFFSKETIYRNKKKEVVFKLKSVFSSLDLFTCHLPELIKPLPWNLAGKNSNGETILKKIFNGSNSAIFSARAIKVFNLMGKTPLTVDPVALEYFKKLSRDKVKDVTHKSFISLKRKNDLEKAYSEGVEIQNHYDDKISHFFLVRGIEYDLNQLRIKEFLKAVNKRFRINLINLWEREFSKKSLAAKGLSDNQVASLLFARKELSNLPEKIAVAASGLTKVQQMEMHNLKKIKLSLKIATSQLSIQEVILTFATMMVGYTLYYNNSIDFRGRVYPVE